MNISKYRPKKKLHMLSRLFKEKRIESTTNKEKKCAINDKKDK
jgi:hypothetical protein